jgi:hypothetical protein
VFAAIGCPVALYIHLRAVPLEKEATSIDRLRGAVHLLALLIAAIGRDDPTP